jgi:hypothetical protein
MDGAIDDRYIENLNNIKADKQKLFDRAIFEQALNKKTPTNGKSIFIKTSHPVNEKANLTFAILIEEGLII